MDRLSTNIDIKSEDFARRKESNLSLIDDLNKRLAQVKLGGGDKYVERHRSRNKK